MNPRNHRHFLAVWIDKCLSALVILLTGAHSQPLPHLRARAAAGRVFYANHNSHGDFMLIWVSLPRLLRRQLRPVAAADYWLKSPLRRFIALKVFNMVLVARQSGEPQAAVLQMAEAMDAGADLLIFPEGTRSKTGELQKAEAGVALIAAMTDAPIVPVAILNTHRIFSNGGLIPQLRIMYGEPITFDGDRKSKEALDAFSAEIMAHIARMKDELAQK